MIGKELPQNEDGADTIKIEPEIWDKIEALIDDRQKRMEENENCLIYKDGCECTNLEEYNRLRIVK